MVKPLSYLSDKLCIDSVVWDIQRNDELSGSGDGRVWQAELAPPLWIATITVNPNYHQDIKEIAATIRSLHGSKHPFMLNDPLSLYPASDKNGAILGSSNVTISDIKPDRTIINISGLPANYKLTVGDKFQVRFGATLDKHAFIEISNTVTANASGLAINVEILPYLPAGINNGHSIILSKPACQMIIYPDSFNPGTAKSLITSGLTFKAIQKK